MTHTKLEAAKTVKINELTEKMAQLEDERVKQWTDHKYNQHKRIRDDMMSTNYKTL